MALLTEVVYIRNSNLERFTYGKVYKIHSFKEGVFHIIDNNKDIVEIPYSSEYFITKEQWRECQIEKILQ